MPLQISHLNEHTHCNCYIHGSHKCFIWHIEAEKMKKVNKNYLLSWLKCFGKWEMKFMFKGEKMSRRVRFAFSYGKSSQNPKTLRLLLIIWLHVCVAIKPSKSLCNLKFVLRFLSRIYIFLTSLTKIASFWEKYE